MNLGSHSKGMFQSRPVPATEGTETRAKPATDGGPSTRERRAPDFASPQRPTGRRTRVGTTRNRLRRFFTWGGVTSALLLVLVIVFRPTPLEVEAGLVARGPLETTVDAEGTMRVVDRFTIAAPVSGRLQRITLRPGDSVDSGHIVARLTPLPLDAQAARQASARFAAAQAEADAARAQRAQAMAVLAQEQRNAARARSLAQAGAISPAERERAELQRAVAERDLQTLEARVGRAAAEVEAAEAALMALAARTEGVVTVRSPAGGNVLRVHEPSERVVQAGAPLLDIGDPGRLEFVVDVLSEDAVKIRGGAPMRLVAWGGPVEIEGRVRLVEPSGFTKISALGVEEQRVHVIGDLVDRPPGLADGYRVEARIVTWQSPDVLKLPNSALFRTADQWSVYVLQNGRARLRSIRVGHRGATESEVLGDMVTGERVILFPSEEIEDGSRVRAR